MAKKSKSSELALLRQEESENETTESKAEESEHGKTEAITAVTQESSSEKEKKKKVKLGPPKVALEIEVPEKVDTQSTDQACDADKTQWENTRFKDEAEGKVVVDPDQVNKNLKAESTPFIAESKQVHKKKGSYLLKRPKMLLGVLSLEFLLCACMFGVYLGIGDNPATPTILTLVNLGLTCLVILVILFLESSRVHVKDVEYMKGESRYIIPYLFRYFLVISHLLRLFLTCADVTISALDNEFDAGTITVLAVQPIVLLLQLGHVVFGLRIRRDH